MILLAIPLFLLLLSLRVYWILWQVDTYTAKALYWTFRTKQTVEVTNEMSKLWPLYHMVFEMWNWSFQRYVIHQDHYLDMQDYIAQELKRNDIDWNIFDDDTQG